MLDDLLVRVEQVIADVQEATDGMPHYVVEATLRKELKREMPTVTFPADDISGWAAGFSS